MRWLIFIMISLMASCVNIPHEYSGKVQHYPPLGKLHSQELGDTLVEYTYSIAANSFEIIKEIQTQWYGSKQPVKSQLLEPAFISSDGNKHYYVKIAAPNPFKSYLILSDKGLCFMGPSGGISSDCLEENAEYREEYYVDYSAPSIKQEFIYNGRTGDYVKFVYREVANGNSVRTPFNQNVQYDLSEGREIGFKGARIRIVEATNRKITYKVIKHFTPLQIDGQSSNDLTLWQKIQ